jgi:hypothetical protein
MARQILRVAIAGLAVAAVAAPASADHVRAGSGFLSEQAVEWHGPRLFTRAPVAFVGDKETRLKVLKRGPAKKDKQTGGFFGEGPTVVLPDITAPPAPGAGFGQDASAGPTSASPEPATLLLLGAGLGGALLHRARRRQEAQ